MQRKHWLFIGILGVVGVVLVLCVPLSDDSTSDDPAKRKEAAAELKGRSDEASLRTLHRLSQDADVGVARAAVSAIRGGESEKYEPNRRLLTRIATEAKNGKVRGVAAAALGDFAEAPVGVLVDVLRTDDAPSARAGAARGLARRAKLPEAWGADGRSDAIRQLYKSLYDDDPEVRGWAITAISKITALRFNYDARVAPAKQQKELAKIRKALLTRFGIKL